MNSSGVQLAHIKCVIECLLLWGKEGRNVKLMIHFYDVPILRIIIWAIWFIFRCCINKRSLFKRYTW